MRFHPYSEVFPLLPDNELAELTEDIKAFGLRDSIWLYDGQILDGRNRWLACQRAKKEPHYRTFKGTPTGALALVVSANLKRRQLTIEQRAFAAAKIATLRVGSNQHSPKNAALEGEGTPTGAGSTIKEAAAALGVSPRSVDRAKQVIEKGSKELQEAAKAGEVSLERAAAATEKPKRDQLKAAKKKKPAPKPTVEPMKVEPEPTFNGDDYEPEDDDAYKANIENVMMADDKLAAMREQLKGVYRELQVMKASRDHYQSQAGAAVRLVNKLRAQLEKLQAKQK